MKIDHDSKWPSVDMVMHIILGATLFISTSLLVAWPEIQAILA